MNVLRFIYKPNKPYKVSFFCWYREALGIILFIVGLIGVDVVVLEASVPPITEGRWYCPKCEKWYDDPGTGVYICPNCQQDDPPDPPDPLDPPPLDSRAEKLYQEARERYKAAINEKNVPYTRTVAILEYIKDDLLKKALRLNPSDQRIRDFMTGIESHIAYLRSFWIKDPPKPNQALQAAQNLLGQMLADLESVLPQQSQQAVQTPVLIDPERPSFGMAPIVQSLSPFTVDLRPVGDPTRMIIDPLVVNGTMTPEQARKYRKDQASEFMLRYREHFVKGRLETAARHLRMAASVQPNDREILMELAALDQIRSGQSLTGQTEKWVWVMLDALKFGKGDWDKTLAYVQHLRENNLNRKKQDQLVRAYQFLFGLTLENFQNSSPSYQEIMDHINNKFTGLAQIDFPKPGSLAFSKMYMETLGPNSNNRIVNMYERYDRLESEYTRIELLFKEAEQTFYNEHNYIAAIDALERALNNATYEQSFEVIRNRLYLYKGISAGKAMWREVSRTAYALKEGDLKQ